MGGTGDGANVARIWSASSAAPVDEVRFETVEGLLRWVDEAEVSPFGDSGGEDGVAIDCLCFYRSLGLERPDGTRATFATLGELVGCCMEEGLVIEGCDADPSELHSLEDLARHLSSAVVDDPDGGRLVLGTRARA